MKHAFLSLTLAAGLAVPAAAADLSEYVGTYIATWADGGTGVYAVTGIDAQRATVTYSTGGKSVASVLDVTKAGIAGSEWFPEASFRRFGQLRLSREGKAARRVFKP